MVCYGMYVCMYACMHACMYVCTYVRMYVCMYVCMYVSSYIQAIETFKCAFERVLPTGDQRTRSFSNCLACECECGCWMTARQPAWHYQLVQRAQHGHIVATIWYNLRNTDTFSQQFFEFFLLLHLLPSLSSVYYCISLASGSDDTTKPNSISLPEDVLSKTGPIEESCEVQDVWNCFSHHYHWPCTRASMSIFTSIRRLVLAEAAGIELIPTPTINQHFHVEGRGPLMEVMVAKALLKFGAAQATCRDDDDHITSQLFQAQNWQDLFRRMGPPLLMRVFREWCKVKPGNHKSMAKPSSGEKDVCRYPNVKAAKRAVTLRGWNCKLNSQCWKNSKKGVTQKLTLHNEFTMLSQNCIIKFPKLFQYWQNMFGIRWYFWFIIILKTKHENHTPNNDRLHLKNQKKALLPTPYHQSERVGLFVPITLSCARSWLWLKKIRH